MIASSTSSDTLYRRSEKWMPIAGARGSRPSPSRLRHGMGRALVFGDELPAKFRTMNDSESRTVTFETKKSVACQTRGTFRAFETNEGLKIDALRVLWEGDGVSRNYIAERTFITESSTAQVINEMERPKLLERHRDPNDKRKRIIRLLPKASAWKERILGITADL